MSSYRLDRGAALVHLAAAEELLASMDEMPALLATAPEGLSKEGVDDLAGQFAGQLGRNTLMVGGGVRVDFTAGLLRAIGHALCAQVCLTEGQPRPESGDSYEAERLAAEEDGPA